MDPLEKNYLLIPILRGITLHNSDHTKDSHVNITWFSDKCKWWALGLNKNWDLRFITFRLNLICWFWEIWLLIIVHFLDIFIPCNQSFLQVGVKKIPLPHYVNFYICVAVLFILLAVFIVQWFDLLTKYTGFIFWAWDLLFGCRAIIIVIFNAWFHLTWHF